MRAHAYGKTPHNTCIHAGIYDFDPDRKSLCYIRHVCVQLNVDGLTWVAHNVLSSYIEVWCIWNLSVYMCMCVCVYVYAYQVYVTLAHGNII